MFVVVDLFSSLPSEIKRAVSEYSINTLQGAKPGVAAPLGARSLFFPLSQGVSLCWHLGLAQHSCRNSQVLVAASLQKTPGFAMP